MAAKTEPKPNPRRYRDLSKPFSSPAHADEELSAFQAGVDALRLKHHLANVYLIVQVSAVHDDGQECDYISVMAWGEALKMESLTAWAFGHETAMRAQAIAKAVTKGKTNALSGAQEGQRGDGSTTPG